MLIKNTISPKTFERKNNEIDHWFTTEKENINKTKKHRQEVGAIVVENRRQRWGGWHPASLDGFESGLVPYVTQ